MPINFACPHCHAKITAPSSYGGRTGRCNQCGQSVPIPKGMSSDPAIPAAAPALSVKGVAPVAPPPQPRPVASPAATPGLRALTPLVEVKSNTLPKILVGLAALVVLALAAWLYFRDSGGRLEHGPLNLAAEAPKSSMAVMALGAPQAALRELFASLEEMAEQQPLAKGFWQKAKQEGKESLGFDFTDPNAYAGAGLDVARPFTFALLGMQADQKPAGLVVNLGVTQPEAVLATLKRVAGKMNSSLVEDTGGAPPVHVAGQMGAAIQEGRLYLAFAPPPQNMAQVVRDFLKQKGAEPLRDAAAFRSAIQPLGKSGGWSGYVNLKAIAEGLPAAQKTALQDWLGLGFASEGQEASAYVLFSEQAEIKKFLQPGSSSRAFMAGLDKPFAALSFSLSDPVSLVKHIAEKAEGVQAIQRLDQMCNASLGVDLETVGKLLKGGGGGLAIYPGESPLMPVCGLVFVKVSNKEDATGLLQKVLGQLGLPAEKKAYGDNFVYLVPGMVPVAVGLVGDYLVAGNAGDRIEALAKGGGKGWDPKFGGTELLSLELFLGDAAKHFQVLVPAAAQKMVKQYADSDAYVNLALTRSGDGLLGKSESRGATSGAAAGAIFSALAVPQLLRARSSGDAPFRSAGPGGP